MITSALTSMASATVTGALSGHLDFNDVLIAGATGAVTGFVGVQTGSWGMTSQNGQAVVTDWSAHAASIATRAGTSAAINQLRGGDFGDSFTNAMIASLAAEGASLIGQEFAELRGSGKTGFEEGGLLHTATHMALGGVSQALISKEDRRAAFIGGAAGAGAVVSFWAIHWSN